MRGNNAIDTPFVELAENGFRNGSAGSRLSSGAELIDQDQCLFIGAGQHILHRVEERTVGAEIIVNGLAVSNIRHDSVEYHQFGCLRGRNEHSPLEHVLE